MASSPFPVALVAPYQELAEFAAEIVKELGKPVLIETGDLYAGLKKARSLIDSGVEVLISRGGTAKLLSDRLRAPVLEIRVHTNDILTALKKVDENDKRIAIVGFENVIQGSNKLKELLGLDIHLFVVHHEDQVRQRIRQAMEQQIDVILGDNVVVYEAVRMGLKTIRIESGREAIIDSLNEAANILEAIRSEAQKKHQLLETVNQLHAVLNSVDDQIIFLDAFDRIHLCNPEALKILGKTKEEVAGIRLSRFPKEPLKHIKRSGKAQVGLLASIDGKKLLLDYLPIRVEDAKAGTLIIGKYISKLQNVERRVRHKLYHRGHVARYQFSDLITENRQFKRIIKQAKKFAHSSSTVLVIGETGTGKEMIAQSIHNECFGMQHPFVALNCATLPDQLLESELFGYVPGAFTGAKKEGKIGFFELAHGGTLLLDEIGELPLILQSRMLRVIEEMVVQRLGDDRVIPVNVRIIASTNKNLANEVAANRFRADLFHRLNVLNLHIPPLCARGEDILVLYEHFLRQKNPKAPKSKILSRKIEKILLNYAWPGNVREMRNMVERLTILTSGLYEDLDSLSDFIIESFQAPSLGTKQQYLPALEQLSGLSVKDLQDLWIKRLAESSQLTKTELAKVLGVSRTTLWKKTRKKV